MDELLAQLQMRNDEIWDLLEDLTLPPLDRQQLLQERLCNDIRIVILEAAEESTVASETIGSDEYDREGWIANDDFDLSGET